jgi:hypothetical protein
MSHFTEEFNGDGYIVKEVLSLKNKYDIECLIETGTYIGTTSSWAADNFKEVYSIESVEEYYNTAYSKHIKKNLYFFLGNSVDILEKIIQKVTNKKCIFYLDAHWGDGKTPTPHELKLIKEMTIKPVIIIHDFYVPGKSHPEGLHNQGHPGWGWDYYPDFKYQWEFIENLIIDVYGENNFEYYYNTEVEGARRGVIYIIPKNN